MAGGSLNDIRMPHDAFWIVSNSFDIAASKANFVVDQQLVPVGFKCIYAEFCAQVMAVTNAITVAVGDDTGTPKLIVNDDAVVAIVAGASAREALVFSKTVEIYGGALLSFWYDSGASDTATNARIRLLCVPIHGDKERTT